MGKGNHIVDTGCQQHHENAKAQKCVVDRELRQCECEDRDDKEVAYQKSAQKSRLPEASTNLGQWHL